MKAISLFESTRVMSEYENTVVLAVRVDPALVDSNVLGRHDGFREHVRITLHETGHCVLSVSRDDPSGIDSIYNHATDIMRAVANDDIDGIEVALFSAGITVAHKASSGVDHSVFLNTIVPLRLRSKAEMRAHAERQQAPGQSLGDILAQARAKITERRAA